MSESRPNFVYSLFKLTRPWQWSKSVFVLLGPLYGLRDMKGAIETGGWERVIWQGVLAAAAFALASSACYVFNDLRDAPQDRNHPRKKNRPIASGAITPGVAWVVIAACLACSAGLLLLVDASHRIGLAAMVGLYVLNVLAYSIKLKHVSMADVVSLAMGFVLRVLGGCFAVGVAPSTWLLNCTLFIAMYLAFGKRLGERRTAETKGFDVSQVRGVQSKYTDHLLRMSVVVTAVGALITYAGYIQSRDSEFAMALWGMPKGFNWLWLTMLPATFGLLRSVALTERGIYDDPTEMVMKDRAMWVAGGAFVVVSALVIGMRLTHAGQGS
jgi:decaprenyl-phosphate phosphoribosyltransferase